MEETRAYYPELEPYDAFRLPVGDGHELYVEQSGNSDGAPVIYLHGGPGGGTQPNLRRYFDPDHYRIILLDQRGCGQSTPASSIENNTTWHLVDDLERVRAHLAIDRWHLFGGSWGCTLALAYAQRHRERVASLILRSVFLGRRKEVEWLFSHGASLFYPEEWEKFISLIPAPEQNDLVRAYYRRLLSADREERETAARTWCRWETSLLYLTPSAARADTLDIDQALTLARLESHYFANNCFLRSDDQILRDSVLLRDIPGIIVQGRHDLITPPSTAYDLKARWPEVELVMPTLAGHAASEPLLVHHLVEATDAMRAIKV